MTEFDWSFDEPTRLLHIRLRGTVGTDIFERVIALRHQLASAEQEVRVLLDARLSDLSRLTAGDFREVEERRRLAGLPAEPMAGLACNPADFVIGRLWAMYRNISMPGSTAVFESESEALAWLLGIDPSTHR